MYIYIILSYIYIIYNIYYHIYILYYIYHIIYLCIYIYIYIYNIYTYACIFMLRTFFNLSFILHYVFFLAFRQSFFFCFVVH